MRITELITKREIALILNQILSTVLKRNVWRLVLENLYVDLGLKGKNQSCDYTLQLTASGFSGHSQCPLFDAVYVRTTDLCWSAHVFDPLCNLRVVPENTSI